MATQPAKFLVIFRNAIPAHERLSAEERARLTEQWNTWLDELIARGSLLHGQPLATTGRVVTGAKGARVTDGPFAEANEVVGGYLMLAAADLDEATEIVKQCPSLANGLIVEVRPLVDSSPALSGVRARPPKS